MSDNEVWMPVPDYGGLYEVSDQGRVRSWQPRWRDLPRLLDPSPNGSGYAFVHLCRDGRTRAVKVARLVLEAFVGPMPEGMETLHINGDSADDRLANLRYGTHAENNRDRVRHGTHHNTAKTHCKRGHLFDDANTYVRPDNPTHRQCRECRRDARRRAEAKAAGRRMLDDLTRERLEADPFMPVREAELRAWGELHGEVGR
jgi:hypothetical protein